MQRVWCFGGQTYRPFGTAAEYCVLPVENAVPLPDGVSFEQGALMGIPGITAYQAIHVAGELAGKVVLVQGGAGAVGAIAVMLAKRAKALVIATVRKATDETLARSAGADYVIKGGDSIVDRVLQIAPRGVDHIVEVAFGANVGEDARLLVQGGSIAVYASDTPEPTLPFWPLVFKNVNVHFLGSDDFPIDRKLEAAAALNEAATVGWVGLPVAASFGLADTAEAHVNVERGVAGRVIVRID
jgi:NADPH2:quinone reductase